MSEALATSPPAASAARLRSRLRFAERCVVTVLYGWWTLKG